jgi:uncharacterized protein (TIRG00374 family)
MTASDARRSRPRNIAVIGGKVAVATALVWWLARSGRLDWRALTEIEVDGAALAWIAGGAAIVFLGQLFMTFRLRLLLRPEIDASLGRVFGITLVGSFWSMLLPGLVGGDAVRALYLCGDAAHKRPRAVAAIFMDRVVGTIGLFVLGVLGAAGAWASGAFAAEPHVLLFAPALLVSTVIGVAVLGQAARSRSLVAVRLASRLPDWLRAFGRSLRDYGGRPGVMAKTIGLSLANHLTVVLTFIVAAHLLHDTATMAQHLALCPLGMTMNMAPITPGGIGVAESALSFLYESAGSHLGASIGLLARFIAYLSFTATGSLALIFVRWGAGAAAAVESERA